MAKTASAAAPSPAANRLLAALPTESYAALLPFMEPLAMPLGLSLYESGGAQGYVYFPTTAIVSLLYVLEDGDSAEIAVTGNDGLVGISLFMGGETTPSRAVVQSAGRGYRLKAALIDIAAQGAALDSAQLRAELARRSLIEVTDRIAASITSASVWGARADAAPGDVTPGLLATTVERAGGTGADAGVRGAERSESLAAADESLARHFRAAGFGPEEARGRAQIAAATMHSLTLRARAGAPKAELQRVADAAVALLSR